MPLLFTGYQVPQNNLQIDRSKPHSNLLPGQRPQALNGTKRFLSASEESTDEDEPGENEANGSELDEDNTVFCRHLALHYCRQSLENPCHVPQASDLSVVRRQAPERLEQDLTWPRKMSRAFHFVCGRDFGLFLHHFFNQMRRELNLEASTGEPSVLAHRVFLVHTGCHSISLRLAIWGKTGTREVEHEVTVYDPNATDHHVQAFVTHLHEFTANPADHHLLSYLTRRSVAQAHPSDAIGLDYFEKTQNTAFQMALFELKAPDDDAHDDTDTDAEAVSGELEIDWSASPRTSYHFAAYAECRTTVNTTLRTCLEQARLERNPSLLKEMPEFGDSLLAFIMTLPEAEPMRQWRSAWEIADVDLKVHLLCGYRHNMTPMAFINEAVDADRLAEWVAMLQTLAPTDRLRVLGTTDSDGRNALQLALVAPEVLTALDPVLSQCAKTHAREVGQLLTHRDSEGCTALAVIPPEECGPGLGTWLQWLARWVPQDELPGLLLAEDVSKTPALVRAIEDKAVDWMINWTYALLSRTPEEVYGLLNPQMADGKPILQYLFEHQCPGTLKAWFDAMTFQLERAEQMTALVQAGPRGLPALAEYLTRQDDIDPYFDHEWQAVLELLSHDERATVLQARDQDGRPGLFHAIQAGNAQGVRAWGRWLELLEPERRAELLQGKDASGCSLLAQRWGQSALNQGVLLVANRPTDVPEALKGALRAWLALCQTLPVPAQMEVLTGGDADGTPWWAAMAYRGDGHLIATVLDAWSARLPMILRDQVVDRLGAASQGVPVRLRQDLATRPALRQQMADAIRAMGDWLPTSLREELGAALASN